MPPAEHLHRPPSPSSCGIVLTHGAGSNCNAPLLVALADAFAEAGVFALRCDLAFRQQRPHGPPFPAGAERDRDGVKRAVLNLREHAPDRLFLGGHSYGARQCSILLASEPELVNALLLLSYPLHPPRKLEQLRTAHFPDMRTPAMFVHGARDPFGSPDEMQQAVKAIPGRVKLRLVERAGHDLTPLRAREFSAIIVKEFLEFAGT